MKYSCYYIIHLGCLMGFIIHFYIIFGTNLLTGGPAQIAIFCLFQCFAEKEYQTESKRNETFGAWFLEQTWSRGLGVDVKKSTRGPRGREARLPLGTPPPSWAPCSSTDLLLPPIYIYIYPYTPKTSRGTMKPYFHRLNLLFPWDPILGPFSVLRWRGNRSWRAST